MTKQNEKREKNQQNLKPSYKMVVVGCSLLTITLNVSRLYYLIEGWKDMQHTIN